MYVVSAFRRTSREVRLKPDTTYYMEPKTALERQASDELERARNRRAVDGPESVSLRQIPLRVVGQVGDRPIGQTGEVHRIVDARELDRVQQVEDVESDLELHPMRNREVFRY